MTFILLTQGNEKFNVHYNIMHSHIASYCARAQVQILGAIGGCTASNTREVDLCQSMHGLLFSRIKSK